MDNTKDKLRIIVIFRKDLEMPPAKAEIQFGHAVATVLYQCFKTNPELVEKYFLDNQPKISMEIATLEDLIKIRDKAVLREINHFMVTDAAHTVFNEPTITCIGIGPLSKTNGNALTRGAKMRV